MCSQKISRYCFDRQYTRHLHFQANPWIPKSTHWRRTQPYSLRCHLLLIRTTYQIPNSTIPSTAQSALSMISLRFFRILSFDLAMSRASAGATASSASRNLFFHNFSSEHSSRSRWIKSLALGQESPDQVEPACHPDFPRDQAQRTIPLHRIRTTL